MPNPAAHVRRDDAQAMLGHAEKLSEPGPRLVGVLGGAVHHQLVLPVVPQGVHRASLERHPGLPVHAIFALDHHRCTGRDGVDVPGVDPRLHEQIVTPRFVQKRCVGLHRPVGIEDRGQLLEVDRAGLREILRLGPARGDASRDDLADEAHFVARQRMVERGA